MTVLLSEKDAEDRSQLNASYQLEEPSGLFPQIYAELERIAYRTFNHCETMDVISTTTLVNEAYLKVFRYTISMAEKAYLMSMAATAMRQIIVTYADQNKGAKGNSKSLKITFDDAPTDRTCDLNTALQIDRALTKIKALDSHLERLLEMRLFAGMTECEIASAMNIRQRRVRSDWKKANALLAQFMPCRSARPRG